MLWKAEEWSSGTGKWHCNCTSDLAGGSAYWWHPARILGLSLEDYILFMIENYNPIIHHGNDCRFVGFSWEKQSDMRKWKNFINKKAREVNYQI